MLLEIKNLSKSFNNKKIFDNISFSIRQGEIFSIVGVSGAGKSTLAKIIIGSTDYDSGSIIFNGRDIKYRDVSDIQMIFQDPYSSLNEKLTVYEILAEPLIANRVKNIDSTINKMLEYIGMSQYKDKYPNQLSGGQRQRIVIGAAMILKPKLVICDEPIASLDLAIQNQIIDLIKFFNKEYKTTFLFISHDINIVKNISHSIYTLGG